MPVMRPHAPSGTRMQTQMTVGDLSEAVEVRWLDDAVSLLEPATDRDARLEAARLELARELHDVVGSAFSMISLQAAAAARLLPERPEQALEALSEIRRASGDVLQDLREILRTMRSAAADASDRAPGAEEIGRLADAAERAGIQTRMTVSGRLRPLPAAVDLAAYRIVQESLTNVLRHSSARSASILVAYGRNVLRLEVEDDGVGREGSTDPGFGIVGMRERATGLGGALEAGPLAEGGFRVCATLPLRGAP
jgi:signal transduction histidine kinase